MSDHTDIVDASKSVPPSSEMTNGSGQGSSIFTIVKLAMAQERNNNHTPADDTYEEQMPSTSATLPPPSPLAGLIRTIPRRGDSSQSPPPVRKSQSVVIPPRIQIPARHGGFRKGSFHIGSPSGSEASTPRGSPPPMGGLGLPGLTRSFSRSSDISELMPPSPSRKGSTGGLPSWSKIRSFVAFKLPTSAQQLYHKEIVDLPEMEQRDKLVTPPPVIDKNLKRVERETPDRDAGKRKGDESPPFGLQMLQKKKVCVYGNMFLKYGHVR